MNRSDRIMAFDTTTFEIGRNRIEVVGCCFFNGAMLSLAV